MSNTKEVIGTEVAFVTPENSIKLGKVMEVFTKEHPVNPKWKPITYYKVKSKSLFRSKEYSVRKSKTLSAD